MIFMIHGFKMGPEWLVTVSYVVNPEKYNHPINTMIFGWLVIYHCIINAVKMVSLLWLTHLSPFITGELPSHLLQCEASAAQQQGAQPAS